MIDLADEELCGRRPWTNVENHQELYIEGHVQGFSGFPYGPNTHSVSPNGGRRKKRIVDGGVANYGYGIVGCGVFKQGVQN